MQQRHKRFAVAVFAPLFVVIGYSARSVSAPAAVRANQAPASTGSLVLKEELRPLLFFVGQWNCERLFIRSRKPIASQVSINHDLEGAWLVMRWDDLPPNHFHAFELWGFDKSAKQFTNHVYDNFGGARLFTSPGWDGDKVIWMGDKLAAASAQEQRFVLERKSEKEFVYSWEVKKSQTDWETGDRLTCKK